MDVVIYGDVLFLINFSMDFLILFITSYLLNSPIRTLSMAFSAGIGALYATVTVFIPLNPIISVLLNVAVSTVMCWIVFRKKIISATSIFYTVGFLLGGVVSFAYSAVNRMRGSKVALIDGNLEVINSRISPIVTLLISIVGGIITVVCGKISSKRRAVSKVNVRVGLFQKETGFDAIVDTGNLLYEQLSGLPVIVVPQDLIIMFLPHVLRDVIRKNDVSLLEGVELDLMRKVRLIPAESISGKTLLIGIIPDKLSINGVDKKACIAVGVGNIDGKAIVPFSLVK